MTIVVSFAVGSEFGPWRRRHRFRRSRARLPVYEAEVGRARVRAVVTGIGDRSTRQALATALADAPDACVAAGFAGGLRAEHGRGTVLAARDVRDPQRGRVVRSDPGLLELAVRCGARPAETFLTADRVAVSADEKRRMGPLGDAVDLESFAILDEARARGIAAVAIRTISDPVGRDLPLDFNRAIGRSGDLRLSRTMRELARHPRGLRGLVRLAVDSRHAARSLAQFLDRYVDALSDATAGKRRDDDS